MTTGNFLTPDLKVFSFKTGEGCKIVKTNFMDLLAKSCVVPGMVSDDDDGKE